MRASGHAAATRSRVASSSGSVGPAGEWPERVDEEPGILARIRRALKPDGLFYASYKIGHDDGRDSIGRYYNYPSPEWLEATYAAAGSWRSLSSDTSKIRSFDGTQATMLHLLGFDHHKLNFSFQGLEQKLTSVKPARVVAEILA